VGALTLMLLRPTWVAGTRSPTWSATWAWRPVRCRQTVAQTTAPRAARTRSAQEAPVGQSRSAHGRRARHAGGTRRNSAGCAPRGAEVMHVAVNPSRDSRPRAGHGRMGRLGLRKRHLARRRSFTAAKRAGRLGSQGLTPPSASVTGTAKNRSEIPVASLAGTGY